MTKAVIFDMDGTALDSMGLSVYNVTNYLESLGLDINDPKVQELAKLGWFITADDINESLGTDFCNKAIRDGYLETHYAMYRNEYDLIPGFIEFLDLLDENGIKYAIATATRNYGAEDTFKRHGILDRFQFITTEGRVGKTKDFPHIYLDAAKRLGASPEETIVFEDALYALKTAKNAGFKTVAIKEEYYKSDHEEIANTGDVFVEDFHELLKLIENNKYHL